MSVILTLRGERSYVWGLIILVFGGYISYVLGVSNSYVWGLVFVRLGVSFLTFGG